MLSIRMPIQNLRDRYCNSCSYRITRPICCFVKLNFQRRRNFPFSGKITLFVIKPPNASKDGEPLLCPLHQRSMPVQFNKFSKLCSIEYYRLIPNYFATKFSLDSKLRCPSPGIKRYQTIRTSALHEHMHKLPRAHNEKQLQLQTCFICRISHQAHPGTTRKKNG